MDVTRIIQKVLCCILILLTNIQSAFCEMIEKGKTRIKSVLNLYHQNSNDGRQVYDNSGREETNVVEPMIFIEHQITEDTAITGHFVFDFWTAASDTKIDGNTGASGEGIKAQARTSANLGIKKEVRKWAYGGNIGFSSEYDYRSINASFDISKSFAQDNFTIGWGIQYYHDSVSLFEDLTPPDDITITENLPRKIFATSINASQIISRKDIMQFGVTFIHAKDNLESTAGSVLIAGSREAERLPNTKSRYALSTGWVHGMGEGSAINANYRYYFDQWGLNANTLRLAYLFEVNDDEDFIELFARYHHQTAVKYYSDSFSSNQEFMTSDSDMNRFTSYEAGVYHSQTLDDIKFLGFNLENLSWSNSFTYSTRTNGLRFGHIQTSLGFQF